MQRPARGEEFLGWGSHGRYIWIDHMNSMFGKCYTVDEVHPNGILINSCWFPCFALRLMKKKPQLPEKVTIPDSPYCAVFRKDGSILVGCTSIPADLVQEIAARAIQAKVDFSTEDETYEPQPEDVKI